jgi:hypothetical protein
MIGKQKSPFLLKKDAGEVAWAGWFSGISALYLVQNASAGRSGGTPWDECVAVSEKANRF